MAGIPPREHPEEHVPLEPVQFPNRKALISHTQNGGLLVPSRARVTVGTSVRFKVTFGDCAKGFHLSGKIESIRQANGAQVGFQLGMTTPAERRAWSQLVAFCARNQEPAKRYPTAIGCIIGVGTEKIPATIKDVSMTGAFIVAKARTSLQSGTTLSVTIKGGLFGLGATHLQAEVIWAGSKQETLGFGAHFIGRTQEVLKLMRKHGIGAA